MHCEFTLTVVTTRDGFIARHASDSPQFWASPEEQALFYADVEAADWAVMGRHTAEAADRPDRRRIVFSAAAGAGEWRRPTQLWIDPGRITPDDLPGLVGHLHPMANGLILGGTRVHDWFLKHGCIARINLTIEPLEFGSGLPLFSGAEGRAPAETLSASGFEKTEQRALNAGGTLFQVWRQCG